MKSMIAGEVEKAGERRAFVAGGGKFGSRAVKYLKEKGVKTLVADTDENCRARVRVDAISGHFKTLDSLRKGEAILVIGDAVELLLETLKGATPSLIIPAVPGHFLASVVQTKLESEGLNISPDQKSIHRVTERLPNDLISTINEKESTLITSYMRKEGRCKDNCSQPPAICPKTGRTKTGPMYKILDSVVSSLNINSSRIFRSGQLIPGVGGISGKSLFRFLNEEIKAPGRGTSAIGTACKCHGILTLLRISRE